MRRSLEGSRHKDLDMVDAEHLSHEKREFTWDNLKDVPFAGDNNEPSIDWDSLPNVPDSISNERKERVFREMDKVGSFGREARSGAKSEENRVNNNHEYTGKKDLSEISGTF